MHSRRKKSLSRVSVVHGQDQGRGVEAPLLVNFLGAIGGFVTSGFIGLFIGAVIVVIAYQLFIAWLAQNGGEASEAEEVAEQ